MARWNILILVVAAVIALALDGAASVGHCPDGQTPHSTLSCGMWGNNCPDGYFCNVAPNDAWAECCPTHCGKTAPLLGTNGHPVYCGRGGVRCPDTYSCKIAPTDAWAVCCLD